MGEDGNKVEEIYNIPSTNRWQTEVVNKNFVKLLRDYK